MKNLIGRKVLGNWGSAGFDYGTIIDAVGDETGQDVIIQWEEGTEIEGDSQEDVASLIVVNEHTRIDAIGIYLLPIEEAEEVKEVSQQESNDPIQQVKETVTRLIEYYREHGTYNKDLLDTLVSLSMKAPYNIYELINKYNYIINNIADNGGIPVLKQILGIIKAEHTNTLEVKQEAPEQPIKANNSKVVDFNSKLKEKQQNEEVTKAADKFINEFIPYLNHDELLELHNAISSNDKNIMDATWRRIMLTVSARQAKDQLTK